MENGPRTGSAETPGSASGRARPTYVVPFIGCIVALLVVVGGFGYLYLSSRSTGEDAPVVFFASTTNISGAYNASLMVPATSANHVLGIVVWMKLRNASLECGGGGYPAGNYSPTFCAFNLNSTSFPSIVLMGGGIYHNVGSAWDSLAPGSYFIRVWAYLTAYPRIIAENFDLTVKIVDTGVPSIA
jgi:hypothetical protein